MRGNLRLNIRLYIEKIRRNQLSIIVRTNQQRAFVSITHPAHTKESLSRRRIPELAFPAQMEDVRRIPNEWNAISHQSVTVQSVKIFQPFQLPIFISFLCLSNTVCSIHTVQNVHSDHPAPKYSSKSFHVRTDNITLVFIGRWGLTQVYSTPVFRAYGPKNKNIQ